MNNGGFDNEKMLPVETLRRLLNYDPRTGVLRWKLRHVDFFKKESEFFRWNGRYAGKETFHFRKATGYKAGYVLRLMHVSHRVAWAIHYGEKPNNFIDHINGDRCDNRIENLRLVSRLENARNSRLRKTNTSGVMGVSPFKGRWRAVIRHGGKQLSLGIYQTVEEAAHARKVANELYGYHENHGSRHKEE